jgi:glycosyltransferase involved in cell wall biosynthesis
MKVSIIIPTKNNAGILEKCLKSIENLDYPKEELEVVIVDGHSEDGTVEIARKYGCRVVYESVGTIGGARNIGVRNSSGEFIVFTDADCVAEKDWLKNLLKEFRDENIASVGGPNITPEDDSEFGKCVGDVFELLSRAGARYAYNSKEVVEIYHNPTCNSAYRREIFERFGGFNPRLVACDDEELDFRIRKAGYKIIFTPFARVYHYRKSSLKSFARMAWNYGVGRGQVIRLNREMARWYYCTPSLIILLILLLIAFSTLNSTLLFIAFLILLFGFLGIVFLSVYLSLKKRRNPLIYCILISTWFWCYGIGLLRGLMKG